MDELSVNSMSSDNVSSEFVVVSSGDSNEVETGLKVCKFFTCLVFCEKNLCDLHSDSHCVLETFLMTSS